MLPLIGLLVLTVHYSMGVQGSVCSSNVELVSMETSSTFDEQIQAKFT